MSSWKVFEKSFITRSTTVRDCPVQEWEWAFGVYAHRPRAQKLATSRPTAPPATEAQKLLEKDNTIEDHWCSVVVGAQVDPSLGTLATFPSQELGVGFWSVEVQTLGLETLFLE